MTARQPTHLLRFLVNRDSIPAPPDEIITVLHIVCWPSGGREGGREGERGEGVYRRGREGERRKEAGRGREGVYVHVYREGVGMGRRRKEGNQFISFSSIGKKGNFSSKAYTFTKQIAQYIT